MVAVALSGSMEEAVDYPSGVESHHPDFRDGSFW